MCQAGGMRLCTFEEIVTGETKNIGCGLDSKRIWSSSSEGCPVGKVKTRGARDGKINAPECTPKSTSLHVACCADEFETSATDMESFDDEVVSLRQIVDGCQGHDYCRTKDNPANTCEPHSQPFGYSCTCGGDGWYSSLFGLNCTCSSGQGCAGPSDKCSSGKDARNVCVASAYGCDYSCECSAPGWRPQLDGKGCLPPQDPCKESDPCASDPSQGGAAGNQCIFDAVEAKHICQCNADGWMPLPAPLVGCTKIPDPCAGDPCRSSLDPSNVCIPQGTAYKCECGSEHFMSLSGLSCEPLTLNPCSLDPCAVSESPLNRCENIGDTYFCVCKGSFVASPDSKSCTAKRKDSKNPCTSDPCQSRYAPLNECIPEEKGYSCNCRDPDWTASSDNQRCLPPPSKPRCEGDPCNTKQDPLNQCTRGLTGEGHFCVCAEGWFSPPGQKSCVRQVSPKACSEIAVRTTSADAYGNPYVCGTSEVGPFGSICPGPVPFAKAAELCSAVGARLCTERELEQDEARDSGCNLGYQATWSLSTSSPKVGKCPPDHALTCAGAGDYMFSVPHKCTPVTDIAGVRCCADAYEVLPPTPSISPVAGPAPITSPAPAATSTTSIASPPSMSTSKISSEPVLGGLCPGDACRSLENPLNICLNYGNGNYGCHCAGDGYTEGAGGHSCEICTNPCAYPNDPCGRSANPDNVCIWDYLASSDTEGNNRRHFSGVPSMKAGPAAHRAACGSFTCSCAQGWELTVKDGQVTCTRSCIQPCSPDHRDPCGSMLDSSNICKIGFPQAAFMEDYSPPVMASAASDSSQTVEGVLRQAGRVQVQAPQLPLCAPYVCECQAPGWFPVAGGQGCQYCPIQDACAVNAVGTRDPCATGASSDNRCIPTQGSCGSYTCDCGGWDWILSPDGQSCRKCDLHCSKGDPCKVSENPSNKCSMDPQATGACDFVCQCAPGYVLSNDGRECLKESCANPCTNGDPCATTIDDRNVCINTPDDSVGVCGSHICQCAPGWKNVGTSRTSCIPSECDDPCGRDNADPCRTSEDTRNKCYTSLVTDMSRSSGGTNCGLRVCLCEGDGWTTAAGGQACYRKEEEAMITNFGNNAERPVDDTESPVAEPCSNNECNSEQNPNNRYLRLCSLHVHSIILFHLFQPVLYRSTMPNFQMLAIWKESKLCLLLRRGQWLVNALWCTCVHSAGRQPTSPRILSRNTGTHF